MATTSLPTSQQLDWSGNALHVTDIVASGSVYAGGTALSTSATTVTAASLDVTKSAHAGTTVVLSKVDGQTVTMPAAVAADVGTKYRFILGATTTSNAYVISAAGDDLFHGVAAMGDSTDGTAHIWATSTNTNTITLGGTANATGGMIGTLIELEVMAVDAYRVTILGDAAGTEASPFSNV